MCGIAGWIDFEKDLRESGAVIRRMTDTLRLRGPDSEGYFESEHVLFGHRRLIVVDPAGGAQPMRKTAAGREYVLVYNGELYNTDELRRELAGKGYAFDSYSDTEVLLTAYICWGPECLRRLNGIFAFAVWDPMRREVFLARDPLGVKPLFYARRGSSLIFGSELKTLLAHPAVRPVIDRDGLTEIFALGPASAPGSGTFKGVREVPPACCLTVGAEKETLAEYWHPEVEDFTETEDEAAAHLRGLLTDAVRRQLVGDVPLCCFLSGGLDSSVISAVAAADFKTRGRRLTTYTIDYADNARYFKPSLFQPTPDSEWAEKMARWLGTDHRVVTLGHPALARALTQAVFARDLPGMADIDSSLFLFCREIRRDFVVALSGECADEVFGGYPWYTHEEMIYADTFPWSRFVDDRRAILAPGLRSLPVAEYTRQQYLDTLRRVPHGENEPKLDARMRELFYLNIKWFMVNLLNRKDRMSMSNSLEVRVPFADYRLVQYAFNIPPAVKFAGGREKGLLRRACEGLLPTEIITRKKSPYPKTHNPEYTAIVCRMMEEVLRDPHAPVMQLLDRQTIRKLVDTGGAAYKTPWFGQLMTGPQLIAYLLQLNTWLAEYRVELDI